MDKKEKLFSIEDLERVMESLQDEIKESKNLLVKNCFRIAQCKVGILIQSKAPGSPSEALKPSI